MSMSAGMAASSSPVASTPTRTPWWRVVVRHSPLAWLLIGFVRLWRLVLSPLYGDVCKFYPTCSSYGLTALETHGALRGSWLIVRRLIRCHPWSMGGYDPVPGTDAYTALRASEALRAHDDHRETPPAPGSSSQGEC